MAIKFECRCGKRLRARESMAMRRVLCPACGELVGVPSLQPTTRGAKAGPLTPSERLRTRRCVLPGDDVLPDTTTASGGPELFLDMPDTAVDPEVGKGRDRLAEILQSTLPHEMVPAADQSRAARSELAWYHVLFFPLRVCFLVMFYGLLLAALLVPMALVARSILTNEGLPLWGQVALGTFFSLVPVAAVGYACSFLDSVLDAPARRNVVGLLHIPTSELGPALKSSMLWCLCFLAGPIVPVSIAIAFWIYGGVFTVIDWLILVELCSLAASYWLFALVSVNEKDRLRELYPFRVFDLIHRLGCRAAILAAIVSAIALTHGAMASLILEETQKDAGSAWLLAAGTCISGMFWATLLFRLVGVWTKQKPVEIQP